MPSASISKGYSVPSRTEPSAASRTTLLASSSASREKPLKRPPVSILGARQAYSASEPPITTARKPRMKAPPRRIGGEGVHRGQDAGAHQEGTEQRQREGDQRQQHGPGLEGAALFRHRQGMDQGGTGDPGMKEAFSVGSQNHQPPQPSSR